MNKMEFPAAHHIRLAWLTADSAVWAWGQSGRSESLLFIDA